MLCKLIAVRIITDLMKSRQDIVKCIFTYDLW
jgi:hypothetical protein